MGGPDEEDHSGEKGEGGVEDSCIKIIISIFFYDNCDGFMIIVTAIIDIDNYD